MKRKLIIWLPALLLAAIVMALGGCSERSTNNGRLPGGGNIDLAMKITDASLTQAVNLYRLTVTARDMDTIRVDLELVNGHYVAGEVSVPVGESRRFVLEGISSTTTGGPLVLYRGETVVNVNPAEVLELQIVLRPVVPLAKLTPTYVETVSGTEFALEFKVFNMEPVNMIWAVFEYPIPAIEPAEVTLSELAGPDVAFQSELVYDAMMLAVIVSDTTGASLVDANGNASLLNISFSTRADVGTAPIRSWVSFWDIGALDMQENILDSSSIFTQDAEVLADRLPDRVITFADGTLDGVIRQAANVSTDAIYLSDVIGLSYLDFADLGVGSLSGMEHLKNLDYLRMSWNYASNLSPLAGLTGMRWLYAADNGISTIAPLTDMIQMRELDLNDNNISNIAPLSGMELLYILSLKRNNISDILPIANMLELYELDLGDNQIVDISDLQGLPNLQTLDLNSNLITDILPLVNNPGIDSGDVVYLYGNTTVEEDPTQQDYIRDLRDRQVTVIMGM